MQIDIEEVRAIRERIRQVLPLRSADGLVRDETVSACFMSLIEVTLIRIVQETQALRKTKVGTEEAKVMMGKLERGIAEAISALALEYVPDATVVYAFRTPESTE